MDGSDPDLVLDPEGVCNFCRKYDALRDSGIFDPAWRAEQLLRAVTEMQRRGRGRSYDCVLGLSGGVDSSYAALVAKRAGLRPLVVHVDNGWNSELAVMNIECVVRGLGLDLVTHVIDWEEFRDLQLSLVRASVVDIELVSDHAIFAGIYAAARKHRIPSIVTGNNRATEVTLPRTWNHRKTDLRNIRAIQRTFSGGTMRTFPHLSALGHLAHKRLLGIREVPILEYVEFVKADAIEVLKRELGWRPYAKKHYESIITRFYQGYILPEKFGIDKRRLHFSLLICAGQMTREAALADLLKDPYDDPELLRSDREFVLKKFGLSEVEFEKMMAEPPRPHAAFASEAAMLDYLFRIRTALRSGFPRNLLQTAQALRRLP